MKEKLKILITGGAGYIGSHTVISLINAGYKPIIVDNFCNSQEWILDQLEELSAQKITHYNCDCTDINELDKIFKNENFGGVIHFAALKAVGESVSMPLKYYKNNIDSLLNILELMKKFDVPNLVFSSSCTVYGEADYLPVDENHPIKTAESPYGYTKQMCEQIINDYLKANSNKKSVILRYFNPVGAHPSGLIGELPLGVPNNLIPFITQTAAEIRPELTIFGDTYNTPDGTAIRDYIHVVDLSEAHVKSLDYLLKGKPSTTLNIGTGTGSSVLEAVKAFEKINGLKLNYIFGEKREGDIEQIFAKTSLSEKTLAWKTKRSLEDALKDAWKWQQFLDSK